MVDLSGTTIFSWKILEKIVRPGVGNFYILECPCGRKVEKAEKTVYVSDRFPKKCVACFKKEYREKYGR
jgi:hypothetical protein